MMWCEVQVHYNDADICSDKRKKNKKKYRDNWLNYKKVNGTKPK